ncbi:probable proteasome inhibitor [Carya illinoinensis]|uniref:probable proteasome inhibitor n=1 Tax=Carya illinoinensis TaxID=32201 RepID=UPI001C71ECFE|nr:probable proteasome inhibitor [Carya illinoinensis]
MDQWNELDDEYAFVYTNPDKGSKKVLVKCLAMEDKLLVDALADGASEPFRLWGWWVFHCSVEDYAGENRGTNYSAQYKNLAELVKKLDTEVLSKLDGSSLPISSDNASR